MIKSTRIRLGLSCARDFKSEAAAVMPGGSDNSIDFPRLLVCATNIVFACELYLRAFLLMEGKEAEDTHNVWSLYRKIEKTNKEMVEKRYESILANLELSDVDLRGIVVLVRYTGEITKNDVDYTRSIFENELYRLSDVLVATSESYSGWRYIFERRPVSRKHFCLYYAQLLCLCEAIDGIAWRTIQERERKEEID